MTEASNESLSGAIMSRLMQQAMDNGSERRMRTLERLREACDDIVSGRALQLARDNGWSTKYFHPHRRLVALSVHEYRRLRQFISPHSEQPGPTKDTIAHDEGLSSYLRARDSERNLGRPPARKGTRARKADDVILDKLDFNDQAIVRGELEAGRAALLKYNTLAAFFHKLSGVELRNRESFSFEDVAAEIRGQIGGDDRQAVANLVARLHDNRTLAGMGLQCDGRTGKVMTDFGDLVLVTSGEMRVLLRLARLDPGSLKPIN